MAATGTSRPMATHVALAVLLALVATPASANQLNFFSGQRCIGAFLGACGNLFQCCRVPFGTISFKFRYFPGHNAHLYKDPGCNSNSQDSYNYKVSCSNDINFRSAILTVQLLKMPTV